MQKTVSRYEPLIKFLGLQAPSSTVEKLLSTLGGVASIGLVFYISALYAGHEVALVILPSMGATAVLMFAVPHGPLSQPWPVFGGHLLSAMVGVVCAMLVPHIVVAAALAVGLSIGIMHVFRCMHPPGGATALAAVIGGEAVHALGFTYVLFPTFVNCVVIFIVGMVFNNLFAWRRYPLSLMHYEQQIDSPETREITVEHIEMAMQTLDEMIDISPEQVKYLIDKADEIMNRELPAGHKKPRGGNP